MIVGNYLASNSSITVTFLGGKTAEITGNLMGYDEQHLVLLHTGREKYIPWSAVAAVTNLSKDVIMAKD